MLTEGILQILLPQLQEISHQAAQYMEEEAINSDNFPLWKGSAEGEKTLKDVQEMIQKYQKDMDRWQSHLKKVDEKIDSLSNERALIGKDMAEPYRKTNEINQKIGALEMQLNRIKYFDEESNSKSDSIEEIESQIQDLNSEKEKEKTLLSPLKEKLKPIEEELQLLKKEKNLSYFTEESLNIIENIKESLAQLSEMDSLSESLEEETAFSVPEESAAVEKKTLYDKERDSKEAGVAQSREPLSFDDPQDSSFKVISFEEMTPSTSKVPGNRPPEEFEEEAMAQSPEPLSFNDFSSKELALAPHNLRSEESEEEGGVPKESVLPSEIRDSIAAEMEIPKASPFPLEDTFPLPKEAATVKKKPRRRERYNKEAVAKDPEPLSFDDLSSKELALAPHNRLPEESEEEGGAPKESVLPSEIRDSIAAETERPKASPLPLESTLPPILSIPEESAAVEKKTHSPEESENKEAAAKDPEPLSFEDPNDLSFEELAPSTGKVPGNYPPEESKKEEAVVAQSPETKAPEMEIPQASPSLPLESALPEVPSKGAEELTALEAPKILKEENILPSVVLTPKIVKDQAVSGSVLDALKSMARRMGISTTPELIQKLKLSIKIAGGVTMLWMLYAHQDVIMAFIKDISQQGIEGISQWLQSYWKKAESDNQEPSSSDWIPSAWGSLTENIQSAWSSLPSLSEIFSTQTLWKGLKKVNDFSVNVFDLASKGSPWNRYKDSVGTFLWATPVVGGGIKKASQWMGNLMNKKTTPEVATLTNDDDLTAALAPKERDSDSSSITSSVESLELNPDHSHELDSSMDSFQKEENKDLASAPQDKEPEKSPSVENKEEALKKINQEPAPLLGYEQSSENPSTSVKNLKEEASINSDKIPNSENLKEN
jgi:uncharacterized coiled-coil protein SlyX